MNGTFDADGWQLGDVRSDPGAVDSDGDRLSDREEIEVWETDPLARDTSGEGYVDLVDPAPTENTTPPVIAFGPLENVQDVDPFASEDLYLGVTARATGAAERIETVRVEKCWREPPGDVRYDQDPECQAASVAEPFVESSSIDTSRPPGATVRLPFSLYYEGANGQVPKLPSRVEITAIDDDGNRMNATVDTEERRVVASGSLAAGSVAVASGELGTGQVVRHLPSAGGGVLARLTAVGTGAVAIDRVVDSVGENVQSDRVVREELGPVPETETVGRWELPAEEMEITLPSGATIEHPELDRERRYGWDQVKRLPGIRDPQDVGEVIEDGRHLPGRGKYDLIIGDDPNGPESLLLRTLEGLVISASVVEKFPNAEYGKHNEKRQEDETVLHEQQWEHIRNDHAVTKSDIQEVVENPDEVYVSETPQGQHWYMWVGTVNGQLVVVRGTHVAGEVRIGTSFSPENGYEYVREWVNQNDATEIYT